jgi:hypothetical protein
VSAENANVMERWLSFCDDPLARNKVQTQKETRKERERDTHSTQLQRHNRVSEETRKERERDTHTAHSCRGTIGCLLRTPL